VIKDNTRDLWRGDEPGHVGECDAERGVQVMKSGGAANREGYGFSSSRRIPSSIR
jgi:hypothetical protein